MTDAIQLGQQAQQVLTDPIVEKALKSVEEVLMQSWTTASDASTREQLWYSLQGLKHFKSYFTQAIDNGKLEEHNLSLKE